MKRRKASKRRTRGSRRSSRTQNIEWVGGAAPHPAFVPGPGDPRHPLVGIWFELPSGLIVGLQSTEGAGERETVEGALEQALASPLAGPRREPARIRVENPAWVTGVRRIAGAGIEVACAPTPEIDAVVADMAEHMPMIKSPPSRYLDEGRVSADAVSQMFAAARALFEAAPWDSVMDCQWVRVDIPVLGVDGACLMVTGNAGNERGLFMLPSIDAMAALGDASMGGDPEELAAVPGDVRTLLFVRGADLADEMRREVAAHGWPVADAQSYPLIDCRRTDAEGQPLEDRDYEIAAALASGAAAFFARHARVFEEAEDESQVEAIAETVKAPNGVEVRLTFPFPPDDEPAAPPRPHRNEPCWCGSGKKYKKCHREADQAENRTAAAASARHHLDNDLAMDILRYATARFGESWIEQSARDFAGLHLDAQIAVPWVVYHADAGGRPAFEHYLEDRGARLTPAEREWLALQREVWLSLWEVTDVDPGRGLVLRDRLSHTVHEVEERIASQTLRGGETLLARVVPYGGRATICGAHSRVLPRAEAEDLERRARRRLGRKTAVPPGRLRDEEFSRYLIRRWAAALADLETRAPALPELRNTSGEALLMTVDHFRMETGARAEIEARLARIENVLPPEVDAVDDDWAFLGSDDVVLGHAWFMKNTLRVHTNSVERADALRERIEESCGDLLVHVAREHEDPLSEAGRRSDDGEPERFGSQTDDPDAFRMVREFKQRHYADWADVALPALGGETPRAAVRSAKGRREVARLLREMEQGESRVPVEERFDFGELRRELGLE